MQNSTEFNANKHSRVCKECREYIQDKDCNVNYCNDCLFHEDKSLVFHLTTPTESYEKDFIYVLD